MSNIKTKEDIGKLLEKQKYISNSEINMAILNSLKLKSPLLIEGAAGVGKTEIAKVLASALDTELVRVQCYEGIDFSKVLYDFNYSKQILYINLLKENVSELLQGKDFSSSVDILDKETDFYGKDFLIERPILKAISPENKKRKVLLIDEIDKSDMEFEAFLLEVLSDFTITIPEFGTIECPEDIRPIVILTSNATRELSEALKRRCMYLYIDYPNIETEANIISKKTNISYDFAEKIAKAVSNIRKLNLKQKPSIAESIIWANVLLSNFGIIDIETYEKQDIDLTLGSLLKNRNDIQKVIGADYLVLK